MQRGLQAIELAQRHGWGGEPSAAIAYPMLAASLIWQGKLDEAERWLMEGEYALRSEVEPATGMLFHLVRGFLEIARGHLEAALAALRAAGRPPGGQLLAAHPLTTEVRAFLLERQVRPPTAHPALIREIISELDGTTPAAPAAPATPATPAAPAAGPPGHLPEPLSQAETRVLRFLQTSLSAPEIAREL